MGQMAMAFLAVLLIQGPAPQTTPPADQSKETEAQPVQPAPDEVVEEKIKELLGNQRSSDPNYQMSPETEKAIETAVEKFLADPEIKNAIADKI